MDPYSLFAQRIGGNQFGKLNQIFKFTLIDQAKKEFSHQNPDVKIIDMGVGEPEECAPGSIVLSLYEEALKKENRIYPNNGTLPFKEAAARYLKRNIGVEVNPESEIVHCIGTKTALAQIPFAFVNPGDTVLATTPGYPVLPTLVEWLGGKVVLLPLHENQKYLPNLNELEEKVKIYSPKLLLLNYPNNPTGAVANLEFYKKVVSLAHEYNFIIIQDAAYADYVFEGEFCSPLQVAGGKDVCIELYSLSKSYNMQGYRIGFVVSSSLLLSAFALVKDNIDNGQFIAIQKAGVHALDNGQECLKQNRDKYSLRLERVAGILSKTGITATKSSGTFYLFVKVPPYFQGSNFKSASEFSKYLISKLGIVSVPWDETGPYVRFSMTFEVGSEDFREEEDVYSALGERLGA